jgi:hypothetical protein
VLGISQVSNKKEVLERYGNAAADEAPDESLLLGQTEAYVEYDASGMACLLQHVLMQLVRRSVAASMQCYPAALGTVCSAEVV